MAVITKVDVSLDVTQPAQEVASVITLILSMYPGREIEILSQIDEEVGSALAALERATMVTDSDSAEKEETADE